MTMGMRRYERDLFPKGNKWILVMHEPSMARQDTRRMLEESGYRVYSVGSGDDAAECYSVAKDCGYPFAAVVVDASMNEAGGGRDAIRRLFDIDPDVKVVVVGGDENPIMSNYREYGFSGALGDEFTTQELDRMLQGMLAAGKETK